MTRRNGTRVLITNGNTLGPENNDWHESPEQITKERETETGY